MKIAIGSDHAGFDYKNGVNDHLQSAGHEVIDLGTFTDASCDYPDYIRAALCWEKEIAVLARSHNDANVICLPARFVSMNAALDMTDAFLSTPFEGGRHQNRVNKI